MPMLRFRTFLACAAAGAAGLASFTTPADADVVILSASSDNTLFEYADPEPALSGGASYSIFAGRTASINNGLRRRAVIKFDLSAIPAGSTIDSVSLRLYNTKNRNGTQQVRVHKLLASFGEGTSDGGESGAGAIAEANDATWRHRFFDNTLWTNPGGDYVAVASAQTNVGTAMQFYTWASAGLTADVQGWMDSPATNHGWIIIGNESNLTTAKRFASRTHYTPAQHPQLVVNYTPPAPTGACCVPGTGCVIATSANCAQQGGTYQGNGTTCSPDPCPQVTGACCLPGGQCITTTSGDCALQGGVYQGNGTPCAPNLCPLALPPFVDELPAIGVLTPTTGQSGGAATYDISMVQSLHKFHRDLPDTTLWTYGGNFPGKMIVARSGQPVTVNWINDLRDGQGNLRTTHLLPIDTCVPDAVDAPTTVPHLHGGKTPPESDGFPTATFLPGEFRQFVYPNEQDAALLWIHDHALSMTRLNVMLGLVMPYVLRDATEDGLGLPSGANEIPLVMADRSFNSDGSIKYPAQWEEHFFGEYMTVNGKVWPFKEVPRGKVRLRLLNGCNTRTLDLAFSNGLPMTVIGSDAGLLPAPVQVTNLTMVSGERYDVIVDFAGLEPGTEIILTNSAGAPYPGGTDFPLPNVMKFVVGDEIGFTGPIPGVLSPADPPNEAAADWTRTLELKTKPDACLGSIWTIDGLSFFEVTEYPRLNETEVWSFVNRSGTAHPMHIHLVKFRILDRQPFQLVNGVVTPTGPRVPPPAFEAGWKDTVNAMPFEITRIIAKFEGYTGTYVYHCHILEHEDAEMMRQFVVVCPADFNGDEGIDDLDIAEFFQAFEEGDMRADIDRSDSIDDLDISAFFAKFEAGC